MLKELVKAAEAIATKNSPVVLAAIGVVGTISTAVFAARGGYRAAETLQETEKFAPYKYGERESQEPNAIEKFKMTAHFYIPAAISATATVACIVLATRVGLRRTAAITAAYSLSEKAFAEYREKVVEKMGEKKEHELREEIFRDRLATTPPPEETIMMVGGGKVLCYESFTGRYFLCDMETLRRAQNTVNHMAQRDGHATIFDFQYEVGLAATDISSVLGWTSDRLMELQFTSSLTDNGEPCLVFEYSYTEPV